MLDRAAFKYTALLEFSVSIASPGKGVDIPSFEAHVLQGFLIEVEILRQSAELDLGPHASKAMRDPPSRSQGPDSPSRRSLVDPWNRDRSALPESCHPACGYERIRLVCQVRLKGRRPWSRLPLYRSGALLGRHPQASRPNPSCHCPSPGEASGGRRLRPCCRLSPHMLLRYRAGQIIVLENPLATAPGPANY